MAGQIDDLEDVARLPLQGTRSLSTGPADLVALARRVAQEQQQTTTRHQVSLQTEVSSLPGVWDEARLDRAIGNLVVNAIKYSPEGGQITISARRERDPLGSDWAVLSVQDEGLGIPRADLPRIFDRFYRGSNVTDQASGTGIGLASARQIIEEHGGTIAVESTEREGSTFTVRLPLLPQEPPSAPDTA
jgi:signal transduction histidine kinase